MAELPSGTVTFLFTDIEGSTALWERDRIAMAAAVARHLAILRDAIATHGGVLFKTVGDAVQAAFPTAPGAITAAVAAQRALRTEPWPDPPGPLQVRMALHTGHVEPDALGDYLAAPLNRLARLLTAGHGSQILLTEVVERLVAGALPTDVSLCPLGTHRLRDLHEPEEVFQVLHPALPMDFPPLGTVGHQLHNLPAPATPFLGRTLDIARVVGLLRQPDMRLVTLTGPGGVGKTRLAIKVASEVLPDFPDGVVFVDLAPITDPSLVPSAIATTLGIKEQGGRPLIDTLKNALAYQDFLLVLDNFEQVLPAAPGLAALLAAAPGLRVLATSRTRLELTSEQEVPVEPMAVPDPAQLPSLALLGELDAVRLFVARARALMPDFALTPDNAAAVGGICARLDGLPLAIELAAARVKVLPPKALLERLDRRLPMLTGGARDLPARQQTLRDAIAWSHDLLTTSEQTLFCRLGVFIGGWTLAAAESLIQPGDQFDIFTTLAALIDKSLVRRTGVIHGEPRFRLLETVREFAIEQLEARGEEDAAQQAHARFFVALAEAIADGIVGQEQRIWIDRLLADLDNLRAVLSWALRSNTQGSERTEMGLRLVLALWPYWFWQSRFAEARRWIDQALTQSEGQQSVLRAATLHAAAMIDHHLGDYETARQRAVDSIAMARACGEASIEGHALIPLSMVEGRRGDHRAAASHAAAALTIFRQLDDVLWTGMALTRLGVEIHGDGDPAAAKPLHEEALRLWRELGFTTGVAMALGNLGDVARDQGDLEQAAGRLRESLEISWPLRIDWVVVEDLYFIADIARRAGLVSEAARILGAADRLRKTIGHALFGNVVTIVEANIAATRLALGTEQFTVAWEEGHALPGDQAVATALDIVGTLSGEHRESPGVRGP